MLKLIFYKKYYNIFKIQGIRKTLKQSIDKD